MFEREVRRGAAFGMCLCAVGLFVGEAHGAGAPAYSLVGTYAAPGGAWDVLPDGRLVVMSGDDVLVQEFTNASTYMKIGSVPAGLVNGAASFLRVSPSGDLIAFGDNNFGPANDPTVYLLGAATLDLGAPSPVAGIAAANLDAAWSDDSTLFVTGSDAFGAPSFVTRIDATSLGALSADVAVSNVGGASGGIATDGSYLYTSNGYDNGPGGSSTGTIKAFALADVLGGVVDFEFGGIEVGDVLSGSPLDFDGLGNLLVGGGDFDEGDYGYAGVVAADAVGTALGGGSLIADVATQQLAPGGPFDFYAVRANHATGEILVTFYGDPNVYRYAIPTPAGGVVLGLGAVLGLGRRRRAS